jgi:predicted ATP-grasp superfamily ATP-dependent carboligase
MIIADYILIVANSGRMLAQAAKSAGLKPLVIDKFADLDTQYYAEDFYRIPTLSIQHLELAVNHFIEHYGITYVVYGSGFECYPESLCYLNSQLTIAGNSPATFIKLHNKPDFFSILDQLDICHPETVFTAPADADNWLVKPMQGQGGVNITRYHKNTASELSVYWQKYQQGTLHSVLFLADGQNLQIIGFNTQWSIKLSETEEFIFSGIINDSSLLNKQKLRVTGWLKKIIPVFMLKGLNSLDFIQTGNESYVLEINPRFSASMQLYNANLLIRHINASQGELAWYCFWQHSYTAYQIVYAERDVIIPDDFKWPKGYMDLPESGSLIRAGQPICSIIARQTQARPVLKELLAKQQFILNTLERFSPYGI